MSPTVQRVLGGLLLLGAGLLSLPAAASLLDGPDAETWIVPVQLAAMAVVGAVVTVALPPLAGPGASIGRRALTGAWWGLLAAFVGVLVFFVLLSGVGGG